MLCGRFILALLLVVFFSSSSYANTSPFIPDLLKPWKNWVLHGHEDQLACTPSYVNPDKLQCDWPSALELNVTESGADFSQTWLVQNERWVQLPGNDKNWPEDIRINGQQSVVLNHGGVPRVKLSRGKFIVTGHIRWTASPEFISIPSHTALLRLALFDKTVDFPRLDVNGRLWLKTGPDREKKIENRLSLQVFRLLDDRIPLQETIHLQLDISGAAREIILGPILIGGTVIPVSLSSPLPAQLEPEGTLKVQVRPGRWIIILNARHAGTVSSLTFSPPDDGSWPEEEIWSFHAQPNLRIVEISGAPSIDPLQTSLPDNWRNYPAYIMHKDDTLLLQELKRGDPQPAPDQLTLQRNIWLRFDGKGYTIQDTITGTKTADWRLEMNPPLQLGRVAIDGKEQFITRRDGTLKSGVEVRKGLLDLTADSIYKENITTLPATGWDHDFQQVQARLFLPPGWRLINGSGIDNIYGTWVKSWTLLDFFVVLIFTIAVARLYSYPLAALAFISLVLTFHEPQAPRWIWLVILVGFSLLRHLPEGKFKTAIKFYQIIASLVLIAIVIPFTIQQLRIGIYPQLEKPWQSMLNLPGPQPAAPQKNEYAPRIPSEGIVMDEAVRMSSARQEEKILTEADEIRGKGYQPVSSGYEVAQYDPAMINQTGPGLPNWQWNTFIMNWSGPVQKDQKVSFILTGPTTNLVLSVLRVIFLVFLILGLFGIRYRKGKGILHPWVKVVVLFPLLITCFLGPTPLMAADIPSPQMLDELRKRLLEPDECFPGCADISTMEIIITPEVLKLNLNIDAQKEVYLPLPGNARHWLPNEVRIDDLEVDGLFRAQEELLVRLPPGNHRVTLQGRIPNQNTVQLLFPLKPHRVTSTAQGWIVEGIQENGTVDNQVQFKRIVDEQDTRNQILETGILPPFVLVERTLRLGLSWKIETVVQRISPIGSAVVVDYPLLPGESILTENIRTKDNIAQVSLDAEQTYLRWDSVLEKNDQIHLKHAETTLWTEIWQVDASPIFHMETSGIPVILHQQGDRWYPTWHPWPGEQVMLTVTRPAGVAGQTLTVEKSHLEIHPGRRATDTILTLKLRSSQGGQHTVLIPEAALLQEVTIDGSVQPIRQEQRQVHLPVRPGLQDIRLSWRDANGITARYRTPTIDIGLENVNVNIDVHLPQNRWPLFMGGPLMGPAVLFWSVILILLIVTFGLSRTGLTPLRFHQWFLLGIGMSQSNIAASLLVVAWLIALDLRGRSNPEMDKTTFNLMQIGISFLTVLAIGTLITAISMGLLGHPDMNIVGNGSRSDLLRWYQDQSKGILPQAWIFSIPMYIYRLAMLAWALWISFSLINLLKWGWHNFSEPTLWHKIPRKPRSKIKNEAKKTQPVQDDNQT